MEMHQDEKGMEFGNDLKVPKARVAVIIGHKGETKRELEGALSVKLEIDSEEGDVYITGADSLKVYVATETIKAIARGFNPDTAKLLLKSDYILEIISMDDFAKNKNGLQRLKGRIIGLKGKSRNTIEKLSETYLSVYGKTVAIIGENENVTMAKRAVENLLEGSMHSSVFKWMEKERRRIQATRF